MRTSATSIKKKIEAEIKANSVVNTDPFPTCMLSDVVRYFESEHQT